MFVTAYRRTRINRLTERVATPNVGRVDRSAGLIRGVKVIGVESSNRRRYPLAMLTRSLDKYEGAKVYVDHPHRSAKNEGRGFREWVGVVENVRTKTDGLYGDLRLRKASPHFEAVCEAADSFAAQFGLSHVADCESKRINGVDHVTQINEVISVDIVTDPATTRGLFESRQPAARANSVTVIGPRLIFPAARAAGAVREQRTSAQRSDAAASEARRMIERAEKILAARKARKGAR